MSDLSSFLSTKNKEWSAKLWDGLIEALGARLAPLEEQLNIQREVADAIIARGLTVIEQELAPIVAQADQILDESTAEITAKMERFEAKVTGGTVLTSSITSASLSNGATVNLTIAQADREFFATTPYIALSRASTTANWAIGKVNSFNRTTGVLALTLEQVTGPGGPYTDWIITSLPAATLFQKSIYEQTLALRQQVADDKAATSQDRADAQAARLGAEGAATASADARDGSQAAYADLRKAVAEPIVPPNDPHIGQLWWDGTIVRVYDGVGFVPTVTASIGGLRFDEGVFGVDPDGVITIGGGYSFVMVWLNGVLLYESRGDYVSTSPTVTIGAATEGDEWKYWAYQAVDATDYDTKEQVNTKIDTALTARAVRVDDEQTLTPAEQGQARANIGAGVLAGFRNKIINGDFSIWQRGNSFSIPHGTSRYAADRWFVTNTLGVTVAVVNGGLTPGQSTVPGGDSRFMALTPASAPTSGNLYLGQQIEDVWTLAGKRVTATAYVRLPVGSTGKIYLGQKFGTGGSTTIYPEELKATITPSAGLTKIQAVFDVPSTAGKTVGDGSSTELSLQFEARTAEEIRVAHISLVEGDATAEDDPFSPRHIQQELALCQRYYQRVNASGRFPSTGSNQYLDTSVNWSRMRTIPSVIYISSDGSNIVTEASTTLKSITATGARFEMVSTGAGDCYALNYIYDLDAEL